MATDGAFQSWMERFSRLITVRLSILDSFRAAEVPRIFRFLLGQLYLRVGTSSNYTGNLKLVIAI